MTDLSELRERVRQAEGPDRELATNLCLYFQSDPDYPRIANLICRAIVEGSVDAALSLVEAKLPGAEFEISTLYAIANIELPLNSADFLPSRGRRLDMNIPLAILEALLTALIEQGGDTGK